MKPNASIDRSKPDHANTVLRTRREALRLMGLAGAAGCAWMPVAAAEPKSTQPKPSDLSADALDEAYRILQSDEPSSRRGLVSQICNLPYRRIAFCRPLIFTRRSSAFHSH